MPPKKTNSGASKKVETKKKEKIIEVSFFLHFLEFEKSLIDVGLMHNVINSLFEWKLN